MFKKMCFFLKEICDEECDETLTRRFTKEDFLIKITFYLAYSSSTSIYIVLKYLIGCGVAKEIPNASEGNSILLNLEKSEEFIKKSFPNYSLPKRYKKVGK